MTETEKYAAGRGKQRNLELMAKFAKHYRVVLLKHDLDLNEIGKRSGLDRTTIARIKNMDENETGIAGVNVIKAIDALPDLAKIEFLCKLHDINTAALGQYLAYKSQD